MIAIQQKALDAAQVKREADTFSKYCKLGNSIEYGIKSASKTKLIYPQVGSENIVNGKVKKKSKKTEKPFVNRLKDNPTALSALFTGGIA
ncbi:MAG: hypothetical protein MHPSP_001721 [Paramarteilia canceri]